MASLSLALCLPGCQREPTRPLTIASHLWPGYELMFLAHREGWLPASGLNLLETASATTSLARLSTGEADGAALTLDEVLLARANGIALNIVLVFDISAGADMLLTRPDITDLAGLAGKRIGVESTALGALMLHKVLAAAGLPKSAVTVMPLSAEAQLETWNRGELDALITYEPNATRLLAEGARRLYDSRKMPDTIFDVLAVKPEAAARHRETLTALVAGHFRALRHFRNNPQDAAFRMAARMGIPAGEVLNAFRGLELPDLSINRQLLDLRSNRLPEAARELSRVMVEAELLPGAADLNDLLRGDFLPEVD